MKHHNSMKSRTRRTASLGVFTLAVLAACDENGFLPPSEGSAPEIDLLTISPDTVVEGTPLTVLLEASGSRAISEVRFLLTGAETRETTLAVPEPGQDIQAEFTLPVSTGTGPDSILRVDVVLIDAATGRRTVAYLPADGSPVTVTSQGETYELAPGTVLEEKQTTVKGQIDQITITERNLVDEDLDGLIDDLVRPVDTFGDLMDHLSRAMQLPGDLVRRSAARARVAVSRHGGGTAAA